MTDLANLISGSCLCQRVQFRITRALLAMGNCHCSMCRRQHGTAFSTYAQAEASSLEITSGADAVQTYASSAGARRQFCGHCGAKLFYRLDQIPDSVWVAAGAFDDDPGIKVGHHIFTASKASWYDITDALPQHAEFPPGDEH